MPPPATSVDLKWKQGISFAQLSKGMVDFFNQTDLHFDRQHGRRDRDVGCFRIWRKGAEAFEFIDAPWMADPMLGIGLYSSAWSIFEQDGSCWGEFHYSWEDQPGAVAEKLPTRVHVLHLRFDQLFVMDSPPMSQPEFGKAVMKYHLLKDLFHALDCAEIVAVNINAADALRASNQDPSHRNKDFRFAKDGTEVLIRQMEERRPLPELDWLHSRIFIDE